MSKPEYIIPVQIGDRLDLLVETIGSSGNGIIRHQGYTLFIPGGLPGDRVQLEISKITPRFGVARILERLEDSRDRVPAPCPVFRKCGGCKFQDLSYRTQMEFKLRDVADSLKHIGNLEFEKEIKSIPADRPYEYRNKGSFAVQKRKGKLRIGFFEQGTHEIADSDRCDILLPSINEAKEWLRGLLQKHNVPIYDEKLRRGFFRGMVLRKSEKTGELLIGFITHKGKFPKNFFEEVLDPEMHGQFQVSGVVQNLNLLDTNVILGATQRTLWGRDHLMEEMGGIRFRLSLPSFFQVNCGQTEKLYNLVEQWAALKGGRAVDAFCGVGGIALRLARAGMNVTGIEEVPQAVLDARENARLNGIDSCDFLEGTVEERLPTLARGNIDTLILDPPRKGCSKEVIASLAKLNPDQVIYISCNPSTLARDLEQIKSYRMEEIIVVDMFPQTRHIETAVRLSRID